MQHSDQSQDRGSLTAYDRYLRGMDTSMRQKVALTAAHLLGLGRIADMGMGSGLGSQALASLYPELEVVGVDLDPVMVELARERHRRPNLSFVAGDIAAPLFPPESLDAIFNSSVLHHVTSFGGYQHARAAAALAVQAAQLRLGGMLIVRDFVAPEAQEVFLDLPADDGDASGHPASCGTAALFERFATEFRKLGPDPGFPFVPLGPSPDRAGWRRYRLALRHASEFILRKDYRTDYAAEAKEEYAYFTQAEFEAVYARLGLRVLVSTPLRNPWILRHRYRGHCELRDLDGGLLDYPATNIIVVGERVRPGAGVAFRHREGTAPLGFLRLARYRNRATGAIFDLVHRPNRTLDIVPFFAVGDEWFVLARTSYPRPILGCRQDAPSLDGSRAPRHVTEPLNLLQTDQPLGLTVENALRDLAGIGGGHIHGFLPGATTYPSPGGILEEVRSVLVQVDPVYVQSDLPDSSGFSTSGRIRAVEARQVLRAAQVGGLPDARLELNVYELLLQKGLPAGDWIGEAIEVQEAETAPVPFSLQEWTRSPSRRLFEPTDASGQPAFLELRSAIFEELDAAGQVVASQSLDYVQPRTLSPTTVAVAPLLRRDGTLFLGLQDQDLPAAQGFSGNSELLVAPAWRLPWDIRRQHEARSWCLGRLRQDHGICAGDTWELGGAYYPTPGLTPEIVHPLAVEVRRLVPGPAPLRWVPLGELVHRRHLITDGHLRIVLLRSAHALGLL
jgi:hypothetical protein